MPIDELLRAERLALVARLRELPDDAWRKPSLCAGWTVHDVLGHLATTFVMTPAGLVSYLARGRTIAGTIDRAAKDVARRPPAELLAVIEENAGSHKRPPGLPLAAPLTDAIVHGADMLWALGDEDWGREPVNRLRPVLDFLVSPRARVGFVPGGRLSGLRLVATDQDWSHGRGQQVAGPSLALAMAVLGRSVARAYLEGDGAAAL